MTDEQRRDKRKYEERTSPEAKSLEWDRSHESRPTRLNFNAEDNLQGPQPDLGKRQEQCQAERECSTPHIT